MGNSFDRQGGGTARRLAHQRSSRYLLANVALLALSFALSSSAATSAATKAAKRPVARRAATVRHRRVAATTRTKSGLHTVAVSRTTLVRSRTAPTLQTLATHRRLHGRHRVFFNPWTEPTYADSTIGDNVDGEDLVVRKAAVDALGPYNGTVIVSDPQTGRVLSMVNQKLALKGAFQPCSTVKIMVSLASLKEQIVDSYANVRISRRSSMDMTRALAMSNNVYFAKLGQQLGFDRVQQYGKLFGLGEKAGLDIPGEEAGYLASEAPETGIGMMTSFGDGIRLTPLELTGLVGAVATGGRMYYLQYPHSDEELRKFTPRIKRELPIADLVAPVKAGMMGAVEYGTARRASYTSADESIVGKTGTCTDTAQPGVHLGWFGSFNEWGAKKLVVVVLLTGGRGVSGPIASGVAGNVYHNLALQNYFNSVQQTATAPSILPATNNNGASLVVQ